MRLFSNNLNISLLVGPCFKNELEKSNSSFEQTIKSFAIPHVKIAHFPEYDDKTDKIAYLSQLEEYLSDTDIVVIAETEKIDPRNYKAGIFFSAIEQIIKNVTFTSRRQLFGIAVIRDGTIESSSTGSREGEDPNNTGRSSVPSATSLIEQLRGLAVSPIFPYYFCNDSEKQKENDQMLQKSLMVEVEMLRYSRKLKKLGFLARFRRKKPGNNIAPGPRTAKDSMDANLDRIKEYYKFSTTQAKVSLGVASGLTVLSFVLFALTVFLFPNYVLQSTCISVACEALSGIIFFTYRKSLEILNYYHRALHEDERFLVSMHFVEQVENFEQKNNLLQKLLLLEMQMNIIDIFASKGNNNSTFDSHVAEQIILSALNTPANTTDASIAAGNPQPQENAVSEPSMP